MVGEPEGKRKKDLQSMSEWDEWDQTDEHTSMPILSMRCGEKQSETESPDLKTRSEEWQVPMRRVTVDVHQHPSRSIGSSCAATSSRPSLSKVTTREQNKTEPW